MKTIKTFATYTSGENNKKNLKQNKKWERRCRFLKTASAHYIDNKKISLICTSIIL